MLDDLRMITTHTGTTDTTLNDKDRRRLLALQTKLEDYLINQEKARFFTRESLNTQIEQHMNGETANRAKRQLSIILTLGAAGFLATLLFSSLDMSQRIGLASALTMSVLSLGTVLMFFKTLPSFQSNLRKAFFLMCVAVGMLGLGFGWIAISEFITAVPPAVSDVLESAPFILFSVAMIWAIYTYARLSEVKSRLLSWQLILGIGVVLPFLITIVPFIASRGADGLKTDNILIAMLWLFLFACISIPILPKIINKVADLYKPPLKAMHQAIIVTLSVIIVSSFGEVGIGDIRLTGAYLSVVHLFGIIMVFFYLRAGYAFYKVSRY